VGTLELIESAAAVGYDAGLVKAPSLFRAGKAGEHTKGLLTYFQAVADRAALPVVLHSGASELCGELPAEVVVELAVHPQIVGLVDGAGGQERLEMLKTRTIGVMHEVPVTMMFGAVTGRMRVQNEAATRGLISRDSLTGGNAAVAVAPTNAVVKTRTKVVGFQMLAGSTEGMLDGLRAGAVGAMPAFAASAPQACYEVLAAWKDGDEGLAEEKQARLHDVAQRVEEKLGVAGIKFGCDLNGYFGGRPRLPLLPLTGVERAEIEALMRGLRT
jgi:4-hydroxy-2-oxoglutarate aldolase